MTDAGSRKPRASDGTTRAARTEPGATATGEPGPPAVVAGRRGGVKSAINRPMPADAAARRKAALHALRYAFEVDVSIDDGPSTGSPAASTTAGAATDA